MTKEITWLVADWREVKPPGRQLIGELRYVYMRCARHRKQGHIRHSDLAELVCSNSLGSNMPDRASGLLKEELRRMGCFLMKIARIILFLREVPLQSIGRISPGGHQSTGGTSQD